MTDNTARKSSAEEISATHQIGDFMPNASSQNIVKTSFQGDYIAALNHYTKEANKLYFANLVLNNQLQTIMEEKNALAIKLTKLQQQKGEHGLVDDKKKRHRRTAGQIQRGFKCPCDPCSKSYGSEGSLSQHLKLKHNQYYKQYANLAQNTAGKDQKSQSAKQGLKGDENNSL